MQDNLTNLAKNWIKEMLKLSPGKSDWFEDLKTPYKCTCHLNSRDNEKLLN